MRMRARARGGAPASACGSGSARACACARRLLCLLLALLLLCPAARGGDRGARSSPAQRPRGASSEAESYALLDTPLPLGAASRALLGGSDAAVRAFFSESLERAPRVWRHAARGGSAGARNWLGRAEGLVRLEDVSAWLEANATAFGRVGAVPAPLVYGAAGDLMLALAYEGQTLMLPNSWSDSGKAVDASAVQQALHMGFSLVFNKAHCRHSAIAELAEALSEQLGALVGANVYVTPSSQPDGADDGAAAAAVGSGSADLEPRQGFATHFDQMESFIVQVSGRKLWYLYDDMVGLPRPLQRVLPTAEEAGVPQMELELAPGDVLYIPRGWVHDARTLGSASVHVTLGANLQQASYAHLAAEAVRSAAARAKLARETAEARVRGRGRPKLSADNQAAEALLAPVEGTSNALTYADLAVAAVWATANVTREPLRRTAPVSATLLAHLRAADASYSMRTLLERSMDAVRHRLAAGGLTWLAGYVLARNPRSLESARGRVAGGDPQTASAPYQFWAQHVMMTAADNGAAGEGSLQLVQALSAVSTQREFDSALRGLRDAVAQNIDFNFGLATHVRTHHELKDEL